MCADLLKGEITKKDLPLTFWCEDFTVGTCCHGWCHAESDFIVLRQRMITVYPESIFSVPWKNKMPDFSLGLSAEVCCGRYEAVKQVPREWWVRRYGEKHGYREEHIERLIHASPENYFRLSGEIASLYHVEKHGRTTVASGGGRTQFSQSRGSRVSASTSSCSSCGGEIKRNADVCDNCGSPQ